jgi:hypothetical protein
MAPLCLSSKNEGQGLGEELNIFIKGMKHLFIFSKYI